MGPPPRPCPQQLVRMLRPYVAARTSPRSSSPFSTSTSRPLSVSGSQPVDIAQLKRKSTVELQQMAGELGITDTPGLRKQDLIFRIEQTLLDQDVVLEGEGVLEIL